MNTPIETPVPHVLLAEDDPVSAAFLQAATAALPARVTLACSIAEALACQPLPNFDVLLLDANLGDGNGSDLLQALRARGCLAPALAHTADHDARAHSLLLQGGFNEVLCKPIAPAALLAALCRHLPAGAMPHWDEQGALAALGGNPAHVQALRTLFLEELRGQRQRIEAARQRGDAAAVRAELHKLAAGCGFVGAAKLASVVRALQAAPLDAKAGHALGLAIDGMLALPLGQG